MKKHIKIYMNNKQWQEAVCKRDKYICQYCKKNYSSPMYFNEKGVNQYVCGHHIKTKAAFPELRYDLDNGVCVCNTPSVINCFQGCHNMIHSKGIKVKNYD